MQRQFRLRHRADFERVRSEGRSWQDRLVAMTVAPNALGYNRFGFITSRHLGGAVVRNRVRRVLREIVRLSAPRLRPGSDITFVARNAIVGQPYSTVKDALEKLFKRAGLWESEA
jgi:ribonuclease P protein component